ncbi:hypothetical protein Acr_04g0009360 [Actinidia rufa]|uniref:Uncharacterized protein n=1 Tax=Actinidia rufa TaxID=165716 RepID=A0A7J0EI97_9ERIC|nr:hypothetical protein Acr_04g0009360 [Actinidia rufa]
MATKLLLTFAICRLIVTVGLTLNPMELLRLGFDGQLSVDPADVESASLRFWRAQPVRANGSPPPDFSRGRGSAGPVGLRIGSGVHGVGSGPWAFDQRAGSDGQWGGGSDERPARL